MRTTSPSRRVATVAALAVVLAGCSGGEADTAAGGADEGYRVGVILPLTGPASAIGNDFNIALEVFREIDPAARDLQIEYIVCDDRTTPDGAAACARKLVQQDEVNMVFGPGDRRLARRRAAGAFRRAPVGHPLALRHDEPGDPIFSAAGNSVELDRVTLELAAQRGLQRVAVLATTDLTDETAVQNLKTANAELGLQLAVERMGPTDVDASAQLNRLLETDPQYVYVATSGAAAGVALKGLKQLGADLPTALIWSNTTNGFLQAAGPDMPSVATVRGAAERAGRDPASVRVVTTLVAAPDLPAERADLAVRARAVSYFQVRGLGELLVGRNGWDAGVLERLRAHPSLAGGGVADTAFTRDRLVASAEVLPDAWFDEGAAVGTSAHCAARGAQYRAAGADEVLVHGASPAEAAGMAAAWARSGVTSTAGTA